MADHVKPILLHAHSSCPDPIKVAITLEALHFPYKVKKWDSGDDAEKGVKGTKFLKISEHGRVPAIEDPNTGVVAWESGACMNYIRRVYDKGNLIGPSGELAQDLVEYEKWEYFLLSALGPMTEQAIWFRKYNTEKNENALERYMAETYICYDVLEGQLKKTGGESVLDGRVSAVDYHYEPWLHIYHLAGLSLDKYPFIKKWLGLMETREEVQEAYFRITGEKSI